MLALGVGRYFPKMTRVQPLLRLERRLLVRIYFFGVLAHTPGEVVASLTLHYEHSLSVLFFQVLMTLSDGIGVLLVFAGVTLLLGTAAWMENPFSFRVMGIVWALGFITATITEYIGAHLVKWWAYPEGLCTVRGIACGALYGWMVLPLAPFWIAAKPSTVRNVLLFALLVLALHLPGLFFLPRN